MFEAATAVFSTGSSDLAGLVGKDGLLPFIDRVPTEWFSGLTDIQEFQLRQRYRGPDGKVYTDIEMMEKFPEVDLQAIKDNAFISNIDDTANYNGWSTYEVTQTPTALGSVFDKFKELPGVSNIVEFVDDAMDDAAKAQFIETYGFDPSDPDNAELTRQALLWGELDETYTFSDNPRGDSEVIGVLQGFDDKYSTGPNWWKSQTPDGTPLYHVITMAQQAFQAGQDPSTIVANLGEAADMILPGSNVSIGDALLQGFLDGTKAGDDTDGDTGGDTDDDPLDSTVSQKEQDWIDSQTLPADSGQDYSGVDPDETKDKELYVDDEDDDELPASTTPPPASTPPPPPASTPPPASEPPPDDNPPELGGPIFGSAPVLPGGGGGGGGGGMMAGGSTYTPSWGELFAYTTLTPYQKRQLEPMKDAIAEAKGMLA